jgi:phosphate transport system substrate-binding protein
MTEFKNDCIALLLVLCIATPCGTATAEDAVTLRQRNGDMSVTGSLVSHNESSYTIKTTKFGMMALDTSRFACEGAACPPQTRSKIGVHGSNTIGAQLMPALITRYGENKGAKVEQRIGGDPEEVQINITTGAGGDLAEIELHSHGSGTSAPSLGSGVAEIGMSSRPITPEEQKRLEDAKLTVEPHVIALDGLLVLTSSQNPIASLTLDQIARIFSGAIKDWSQLGRAPGKINLYARDDKSGTFDTFNSLVLKPRNLKISPEAKRFESTPDLSDEVARDPDGVGFGGFAYLRNAKGLSISSSCGIISPPSPFNVKTEDYPLSRRLFLYTTSGIRSQIAKEIVEFSMSDAAQSSIVETGFIDLGLDFLAFSEQGERVAGAFDLPQAELTPLVISHIKQMTADMRGARRMSITFRFEKGSDKLDVKARQDMLRLARFMSGPEMQHKEVLLLGFADAMGPFEPNVKLAQKRADAVRAGLLALGGGVTIDAHHVKAKSYGKLMPVACNDNDADREKNRRVEVWVKG